MCTAYLNVPMSVTGSSLQYTAVQPNLNGPAVPGDLMPVRVDVLAEGVADREPLLSQNGVGCGTLASLRFPHHHQPHLPERGQFSSVQFRSRWYLCALKSPYVLYHVSRKFSPLCLPNSYNVYLTDDGLLSSFQRRSTSASAFHASLLQVIEGVISSALCPHVVSQVPQYLRFMRRKPLAMVALPISPAARSFLFTPACPGQYIHSLFVCLFVVVVF